MTIARFTALGDVVSLREAMDRLFEDSFIRPSIWPGVKPRTIKINATSK